MNPWDSFHSVVWLENLALEFLNLVQVACLNFIAKKPTTIWYSENQHFALIPSNLYTSTAPGWETSGVGLNGGGGKN